MLTKVVSSVGREHRRAIIAVNAQIAKNEASSCIYLGIYEEGTEMEVWALWNCPTPEGQRQKFLPRAGATVQEFDRQRRESEREVLDSLSYFATAATPYIAPRAFNFRPVGPSLTSPGFVTSRCHIE